MLYEIERTTQFKKDFKLAIKRGCNMDELKKLSPCSQTERLFLKNIEITVL